MPVIKPTCVRDVKLRANLADVVSRVVTLRKAGGTRLKGLCPFHNEKTPSFHVDPDKGFYKCFGCGKAGDAITFVRETEQLAFAEAVEALGQRFGIPIEYEEGSGGPSSADRTLRQEVFDLHDVAAEHFFQAFKAKDATGDFFRKLWIEKRKFPAELADEFKIGAADADGGGLGAVLMRRKFSEEALRRCGLFFIYDDAALTLGALRPRFRGRLMIPIRDHQGRVCAFTARQTELTPDDDPAREAKYVNSPETPVFTKGNLLFNLDRARTQVGDGKPFVMVEGQLDALRCWSVGLKTAIAPQGTSITESQLVLLRRYHTQVECFFDSDTAGQKAALRFLPMALKAGLEVRFLTLAGETKLDPDLLFLERGLEAYEEVRRNATQPTRFYGRARLPKGISSTPEEKRAATEEFFDLILNSESNLVHLEYILQFAAYVGRPAGSLQEDFARFIAKRRNQAVARTSTVAAEISPEKDLLLLWLHFDALHQPLSGALRHEWVDTGHTAGVLLNRFVGEFEHGDWPGRDHVESLLETDSERTLVAELLFETPNPDDPFKTASWGLRQLRERAYEPRIRQIEHEVAEGRGTGTLVKERLELSRLLRMPIELRPAADRPK